MAVAVVEAYHVAGSIILHVCRNYGDTGCQDADKPDYNPALLHDVYTYPGTPDEGVWFVEHLKLCAMDALISTHEQMKPAQHTSNITHIIGMTLDNDNSD